MNIGLSNIPLKRIKYDGTGQGAGLSNLPLNSILLTPDSGATEYTKEVSSAIDLVTTIPRDTNASRAASIDIIITIPKSTFMSKITSMIASSTVSTGLLFDKAITLTSNVVSSVTKETGKISSAISNMTSSITNGVGSIKNTSIEVATNIAKEVTSTKDILIDALSSLSTSLGFSKVVDAIVSISNLSSKVIGSIRQGNVVISSGLDRALSLIRTITANVDITATRIAGTILQKVIDANIIFNPIIGWINTYDSTDLETDTRWEKLLKLDTNKVIIIGISEDSSGDLYGVVGDISDTTVTYGDLATKNVYIRDNSLSIVKINSTKILICYSNFDSPYNLVGIIATISGSTITFGDPISIDAEYGLLKATTLIKTDTVLITYEDGDDDIYARTLSISGSSFTVNNELLVESRSSNNYLQLIKISTSIALLIFYYNNEEIINAIVLNAVGADVLKGTKTTIASLTAGSLPAWYSWPSLAYISSNKVMLEYVDYYASPSTINYRMINMSGYTITPATIYDHEGNRNMRTDYFVNGDSIELYGSKNGSIYGFPYSISITKYDFSGNTITYNSTEERPVTQRAALNITPIQIDTNKFFVFYTNSSGNLLSEVIKKTYISSTFLIKTVGKVTQPLIDIISTIGSGLSKTIQGAITGLTNITKTVNRSIRANSIISSILTKAQGIGRTIGTTIKATGNIVKDISTNKTVNIALTSMTEALKTLYAIINSIMNISSTKVIDASKVDVVSVKAIGNLVKEVGKISSFTTKITSTISNFISKIVNSSVALTSIVETSKALLSSINTALNITSNRQIEASITKITNTKIVSLLVNTISVIKSITIDLLSNLTNEVGKIVNSSTLLSSVVYKIAGAFIEVLALINMTSNLIKGISVNKESNVDTVSGMVKDISTIRQSNMKVISNNIKGIGSIIGMLFTLSGLTTKAVTKGISLNISLLASTIKSISFSIVSNLIILSTIVKAIGKAAIIVPISVISFTGRLFYQVVNSLLTISTSIVKASNKRINHNTKVQIDLLKSITKTYDTTIHVNTSAFKSALKRISAIFTVLSFIDASQLKYVIINTVASINTSILKYIAKSLSHRITVQPLFARIASLFRAITTGIDISSNTSKTTNKPITARIIKTADVVSIKVRIVIITTSIKVLTGLSQVKDVRKKVVTWAQNSKPVTWIKKNGPKSWID